MRVIGLLFNGFVAVSLTLAVFAAFAARLHHRRCNQRPPRRHPLRYKRRRSYSRQPLRRQPFRLRPRNRRR